MNYRALRAERSLKAGSARISGPRKEQMRKATDAADARRGGLEVWAQSVMPPIGTDLSNDQALAVAFRHLAAIGFAENMAGHITWQLDGQSDMLVNPWGLWWQELTASDICVVDEDAR